MNVLAACNGPDSPVRKVVFKSSAHVYGCEQDDPAFFTEEMTRRQLPRTPLERDLADADHALEDFAERKPDVTVTRLRFASGLGPNLRTSWSRLLGLPAVPGILGFDPRVQFVHEEDIVGCLEHAVHHELDGVFNCAADGVLALSEAAGVLGKPYAPVLPPVGTGLAAAVAKRIGVRLPPEVLRQMRYSPSVRPSERLEAEAKPRNVAPGATPALDDLDAAEIVALLPSLDRAGLRALHAHETAHRGRRTVITAIERLHPWEAEG
jgi:UDP-glucose 4-epimerase